VFDGQPAHTHGGRSRRYGQWIANLLESEFDVVTVADGQAAVEATGTLQPDLVVLDVSMPVLNGFEAAAVIRQLPDAPRIVFCTAYDDPDFAKAALALGASALVLKRNMLVDLVAAVRQALKFHAVCFYEDAVSLSRAVAGFIGGGLVADQPAVLIATSSHGVAILLSLEILWNQLIARRKCSLLLYPWPDKPLDVVQAFRPARKRT
jgi:CheY-like chemotaxis protein